MADINETLLAENLRIARITKSLDERLVSERDTKYAFLAKVPIVPADASEIIGRYTGSVVAADIITDDAQAVVYEGGQITNLMSDVPNIKVGQSVNQSLIRHLAAVARGLVQTPNDGILDNITGLRLTLVNNLLTGVYMRMNALVCAMMLDSATYDRGGVKLTGTFGTPAGLKATPGTVWSNTAATPIDDMMAFTHQTGPDDYGKVFNHVIMPSAVFRNVVKTTEFQDKARLQAGFAFAAGALVNRNLNQMRPLFEAITGLTLELNDEQIPTKNSAGTLSRTRVLPSNKVILCNSADFNNPLIWDFANTTVTETVVAPLLNASLGFTGPQAGPVTYFTGNPSLNPPNLQAWCVASGFPRKHDQAATAILTVG